MLNLVRYLRCSSFGSVINFFIPHTVTISEDSAEFISILRHTKLVPGDVLSISDGIHFVTIRHKKGKVILSTLMNGVGSIKSFLSSNNPGIENISAGINEFYDKHPIYSVGRIGEKKPLLLVVILIIGGAILGLYLFWSLKSFWGVN